MKFIKYFILSIAFLLQANLFTAVTALKKPIAKSGIKALVKAKKIAPVKKNIPVKAFITPLVKPVVAKPVNDLSKEPEKLFLELIKKTYPKETVNPNAAIDKYFSPDLKKYANLSIGYYLTSTKITIFDNTKPTQIDLSKHLAISKSWIFSCSWSSDSKYLVLNTGSTLSNSNNYSYNYQILIINTDNVTDTKTVPSDVNYFKSILSPDNSLLNLSGCFALKILDATKNTELYNKTFDSEVAYASYSAWSHDSCSLAILLSNNTILILNKDLKSGKWIESKTLSGFKETLSSCTYSPDGFKLLLNSYNSYLNRYQLVAYDINSKKESVRFDANSAQQYYWIKNNLIHCSSGSKVKFPVLNSANFIKNIEAQPQLSKYIQNIVKDSSRFFNLINTKNLNEHIKEYFTKLYLENLEKTKKIKFTIKSLIEATTDNTFLGVIPPNTLNAFTEKISKFKFDNISQTKQHFLCNLLTILNLYKKHAVLKKKNVSNLLLKIYSKEKEEYKKGNYVFYHGRYRTGTLLSEIYKNLWITTRKQKIKDNFVFFRFNQESTAPDNDRNYLFMNHALFGNAHETTGACTLTQYFLINKSCHNTQYSIESLFTQFDLLGFYQKNKSDLKKLEALYTQASKHGELLLILIPKNKIHLIRIVQPGGYTTSAIVNGVSTNNTKAILDAIKTNQQVTNANYFEWSIAATTEYLLDPINGPDIYSFELNDEKIMN